jgi:hypothetical protein
MMRHLVVCAALFCAFQLSAHAGALLPSQEEQDLVTVKTCRDHEVLSSLKAAIDRSLQANSVLARGMHAGDVHLEAVWIDRPAVICSTTVAAKGIRERSSIRLPWRDRPTSSNSAANPEEANYFRTNLRSGQSIWICRPGALGRLRPVPSDALIQPRRLATICSTDYHHRHAGWGMQISEITKRRTGHDCRMRAENTFLDATWRYPATISCPTPRYGI